MGISTSNLVIRWINFLTMLKFSLLRLVSTCGAGFAPIVLAYYSLGDLWKKMNPLVTAILVAKKFLAIAVIGFGVWMSTHHENCRRSLTFPVMGLGAVIFVISIVGFLGALKNNTIFLWIYLIMLCLILVAILGFTVLAFIVTNSGSGHTAKWDL